MKVLRSEAYAEWIDNLKDPAGRARLLMRVDRLIHGNPGNHRNLTEGVSELKIDVGPGYRVYYSIRTKDIAKALELNRMFTSDSR
jgi:putative addiction module killer protein